MSAAVGCDGAQVSVDDLLRKGELTVRGRIREASNGVLYCTIRYEGVEAACVYKPVAGERPLWDFPDGTLAQREVAAYEVSEATGWGLVPPTVLRDGPYGEGMIQLWIDGPPQADDDADEVTDEDTDEDTEDGPDSESGAETDPATDPVMDPETGPVRGPGTDSETATNGNGNPGGDRDRILPDASSDSAESGAAGTAGAGLTAGSPGTAGTAGADPRDQERSGAPPDGDAAAAVASSASDGDGLLTLLTPQLALVAGEETVDGWKAIGLAEVGEGRTALLVHADDERLRRLAVLDAVINNGDRKGGHLLTATDGRLYAIDHGVTFNAEDKLRTLLWGWAGEPLPAEALTVLDRLAEELAEGAGLATRLAVLITPAETEALRARVRELRHTGRHPAPSGQWPAIPWPPV